MKRLIVYAGANGAGKSTLRADGGDPVELEIDPDRIAREINPLDPRAVDFAAGKEALRRFDQALAVGLSLSLETTLTGRTVLARMQAARDAGYDVVLRYVGVDGAETNIRRVTARAAAGGRWIESEVVRRRVAGSLENLPAAIAVAHRAVLLDNSGLVHRRVLEVEKAGCSTRCRTRRRGWPGGCPARRARARRTRPSWSAWRARVGPSRPSGPDARRPRDGAAG